MKSLLSEINKNREETRKMNDEIKKRQFKDS